MKLQHAATKNELIIKTFIEISGKIIEKIFKIHCLKPCEIHSGHS